MARLEQVYFHGPGVDQLLAYENLNPANAADHDLYWTLADRQGTVRDLLWFDNDVSSPGQRGVPECWRRVGPRDDA